MKPSISKPIDSANSQAGTPNGTRTIITIGDVNGMIDIQNATAPSGFLSTTEYYMIKEMISGIVIGIMNCCVSVSLSTAAPIAPKREP